MRNANVGSVREGACEQVSKAPVPNLSMANVKGYAIKRRNDSVASSVPRRILCNGALWRHICCRELWQFSLFYIFSLRV